MFRNIFILSFFFNYSVVLAQSCSPDSLQNREVWAIATDNNISLEALPHQVFINTDCVQNEKLLLHLVGSFDNPASTTYFPALAANNGFKVINLKYENGTAAFTACGNSADMDCYTHFREEIIFGADVSETVEVDFAHSIMNRLQKLLIHLSAEHPTENWDLFLNASEEIDWSNIVVSGHSQGGGHAAFIAKEFEVERVLMFASPNDYSAFFDSPALWLDNPSQTFDSLHYTFGNLFDEISDFSNQYQIWETLGLLEELDSVNVDNIEPPYNSAHVLYTKDQSATGLAGPNHGSVIIDKFTPLVSEVPIFEPVWRYMLGMEDLMSSDINIDMNRNKVTVFPNPSSNSIRVKSDFIITKLSLLDPIGNLCKSVSPNNRTCQMGFNVVPGIYFLQVQTEDNKTQVIPIAIHE